MLSDRDFARLFAGRLVSTFGSAMAPIAMAFAVLDLTASAAWVGRVLACQVAAWISTRDNGKRKKANTYSIKKPWLKFFAPVFWRP